MKKSPAVADLTADKLALYGRRAAERYTDDDLAVLGEMSRLQQASLNHQHITRLPPFSPALRALYVNDCASLESLAGIERCVGLQLLALSGVFNLDLARACELLRELPELTELVLEGFAVIPASIRTLPSLLALRLRDCQKLDLTATFATVGAIPTLRSLTLRGRVTIPDALAPLANLTTLEITRAIGELPPSIGALGELTKLLLEDCELVALPATIGQLHELEVLNLKSNPIVALPDEICDLVALQELDLRNTQIKVLPAQLGRLTQLRKLDAYAKKLRAIPESIGDLANLRDLSIPWEKVTVPDSIYQLSLERFSGPSAVHARIVLRAPPTPETDSVWLHDAKRLPADFGDPRRLELSLHDHVAPIPQLSALRRVTEVRIDTGNLADAFTRLATAEHLRALTICGEHPVIPDELGELVQLEKLTINADRNGAAYDRSKLRRLPRTIGKLVGLTSLTITRNELESLPDELGDLPLTNLSLDPGTLTTLPAALGRLAELTTLTLSSGVLVRLPEALARCSALVSLIVTGTWAENRIENLEIVATYPALRALSLYGLSKPPLDRLLRGFAGASLERLDLRGTGITELPASIGGLSALTTLELDDTRLKRFPPELRACTALRAISVPIYELERDVLATIKTHLPAGRWKKTKQNRVVWYTRSD